MQLPYANLQLKYHNEGASMPLVLPVHMICNTSDEQIYSNIRTNSRTHDKNWVKCEEPHDGVAIIVGSAPSILENIDLIRQYRNNGGKIFALNNAANTLFARGIKADYQVMIDAREQTSELIGPAYNHLFASQVHPTCFKKKPNAQLWHLQVGNIEEEFPEYNDAYALIGGAASVGNTATCLAYAMGYREIQIFGMDSSHTNGQSHAEHQKINDGDPCAYVTYNGKEYYCSLTMKLQAEKFQETAAALVEGGCKIEVHGDGLLPDMWRTPPDSMSEVNKYTLMWNQPCYKAFSPGEQLVDWYIDKFKPQGKIIDFGCGTGRAALKMHKAGLDVLLLDFTENSRDDAAMALPFQKQDLTQEIAHRAKFGYCTDVMEHLPPESVDVVIKNIMDSAEEVFFQISTIPDSCGEVIGQNLHLTVEPHVWWLEKFRSMGYYVYWQQEQDIAALFYIKRRG